MKKRFIFLLVLSFCDTLLIDASQLLAELFLAARKPRPTVFKTMRVKTLDSKQFAYNTNLPRTGFSYAIEAKSLKIFYNNPASGHRKKKHDIAAEIGQYPRLQIES